MENPAEQHICDLCGFICKKASGIPKHRGKGRCITTQAKNLRVQQQPTLNAATPGIPPDESLADRLRRLRAANPVLPHVPAAARVACSDALADILDNCCDNNDESSWSELLTFAPRVLTAPPGKSGKSPSLATSVKANLKGVPFPPCPRPPRKKKAKSDEEALRKMVNLKLQDGNITGAVRLLTSKETIAPLTEETISILEAKHPSAPADECFSLHAQLPTSPAVSEDELLSALNSSPTNSSAGPDGLRVAHLKDLLLYSEGHSRNKLLHSLTRFANHVLQKDIPPEARKVFFGALIVSFNKPGGGIRPIAVGCTLRRLIARIPCYRLRTRFGEMFRPVQYGFGTRYGAEIVVHAARAFLLKESPDVKVFLKIDFKNAFNTIRRDRLLDAVFDTIPEYYHFVRSAYGADSTLFCGEDVTISSAAGVQQGDPLGPPLFCLLLNSLSHELLAELSLWYLDDAAFGGDVEQLMDLFQKLQTGAEKVGLELNMTKCEIFVQGGTDAERMGDTLGAFLEAYPDVQIVFSDKLDLLGSPLLACGIVRSLKEKMEGLETLIGRLDVLPSHQSLFLLKNCLAIPKLLYLLRTTECWKHDAELEQFDQLIRSKAEDITNVKMTASVWQQASLPLKYGGLGLTRASDIALPAYIASLIAASEYVQTVVPDANTVSLTEVLEKKWSDRTGLELPSPECRKFQSVWTNAQYTAILTSMMETADVITSSRLLAVSSPESRAWLSALPVCTFGTLLEDTHLRIAVALRLGAEICKEHRCICKTRVDVFGHHGLSCKRSKGRHPRHSALNEVVRRALISAKIPAVRKPPGLDRGDGKRPDGLTLMPWKSGMPLVWDVTVADTFAISYIARTTSICGAAANQREREKELHYSALSDRYVVQPVAFETMGSWGTQAKAFLKEVGMKIRESNGNPRSMEFLRQRISVEIQRGNGLCIMGTVDFNKDLEDVFLFFNV